MINRTGWKLDIESGRNFFTMERKFQLGLFISLKDIPITHFKFVLFFAKNMNAKVFAI